MLALTIMWVIWKNFKSCMRLGTGLPSLNSAFIIKIVQFSCPCVI